MISKVVEDIQLLKSVCEPCALDESRDIIEKLFLTLSASENGIGLAANQIGIAKRICVVNVKEPLSLVNPKIIGAFGKIMFDEGCLSFPGLYICLRRPVSIRLRFHDTGGGVGKGPFDEGRL